MDEGERVFKELEQMLRQMNKELRRQVEKLEEERDQLDEEVLRLRTDKMDAFARHAVELEEVTTDSKTSVAIVVLQAKVGMVEEDPASWDVAGWKNAINRLMGLELEEKKADNGQQVQDVGATSGAEV